MKTCLLVWVVVSIFSVEGRSNDALLTNRYVVPPTFLTWGKGPATPFVLRTRETAQSILQESGGVQFGPGASAVYNPNTSHLIVRNTESQMEKVAALLDKSIAQVSYQIYLVMWVVESDLPLVENRDDPSVVENIVASPLATPAERLESFLKNPALGNDSDLSQDSKLVIRRVLTEPQFQLAIRAHSATDSTTVSTAPSIMVRSSKTAVLRIGDHAVGVIAKEAFNQTALTLDLFVRRPGTGDQERTVATGRVVIPDGSVVVLSRKDSEGKYTTTYLKAEMMDPAGLRLNPTKAVTAVFDQKVELPKIYGYLSPDAIAAAITASDEAALQGSRYLADGKIAEAEAEYRKALHLLPENEATKQRERAYLKQWLRTVRAGK